MYQSLQSFLQQKKHKQSPSGPQIPLWVTSPWVRVQPALHLFGTQGFTGNGTIHILAPSAPCKLFPTHKNKKDPKLIGLSN